MHLMANWMKAGAHIGERIAESISDATTFDDGTWKSITVNVNGNIDDFTAAAIREAIEKNTPSTKRLKHKSKNRKQAGFLTHDEDLLHKICNAGLLGNLRGVNERSNESGTQRVYSFDLTPEIADIVNAHKSAGSQVSSTTE